MYTCTFFIIEYVIMHFISLIIRRKNSQENLCSEKGGNLFDYF